MSSEVEREVMRLLAGGLPQEQAAALRRRLEADPRSAALLASWGEAWGRLELPEPAAIPLGFATAVAARARAERPAGPLAGLAPAWARALGAAALVAGLGLGVGLGLVVTNGGGERNADSRLWSEPALVEAAWTSAAETPAPTAGEPGS